MSTRTLERLTELIEQEIPDLIRIRRDLHQNPGIAYEEHYASDLVKWELERASISFRGNLGKRTDGTHEGTGVVAHLPGESPLAIGLRADMDALPIYEQNTCEYVSKVPGVMHACGHDGHTTILIGAARVLAALAKERTLPQPVRLVFQPAEEGGAGGKRMIDDGCLDGSLFEPPVRYMFALHGWPEAPLGTILTRVGPITAATCCFDISIKGRGGHAAFPHFNNDPIVAAGAVISAVQSVVSRNVDPLGAAVISITQCHAGDNRSYNVIPGETTLRGTIRALDSVVMDQLKLRLREVTENIAVAHGCCAEVGYVVEGEYPSTFNHVEAVNHLKAVVPESRTDMPAVMGGEDFAYYGEKVPSAFFALGLRPGPDRMPGLHHPCFDFNDDAIKHGVEAFCRLALHVPTS